MKVIKKLLSIVSLLAVVFISSFSFNAQAQSGPCEEEVTFQFDDGAWCELDGTSCIVVWGCGPGSNN